ncbi:MAG: transketolase C-terminal domain-containing protein [Trueperaceae bacterium]
MTVPSTTFPLDVTNYRPLTLDPGKRELTREQRGQWETNIGLMRDVIVFFTAVAGARGLSGHTGGAYDVVPEALLADGFMRGSERIYPVLFDEAGHRVALQYALSAFNGAMPFEELLYYREENRALYGHPEIDKDRAIGFASGRLGHLWPYVNGVAMANPEKAVILLGSDGSQMEGNDAEAARLAVAKELNVKLLLDDNNVTIAGHPSEYLPGFDMTRTLEGHGLTALDGEGEDFDSVYARFQRAIEQRGPVAVINRRLMAPGLPKIEGKPAGHEVIGVDAASEYLLAHGHEQAAEYLSNVTKHTVSCRYLGSSEELGSNRKTFGKAVSDLIDELPAAERSAKIMVIDSDLAGSTGLDTIAKRHPEVFVTSGVMERGNFSAAAGFGFEEGRTGVFSTFSAFLEMILSEVTMARLNRSNVLCHFSHAGVDAIADNTSHFGINVFFADNGVEQQGVTPLYFPADAHQFESVVRRVLWDEGVRFLFSTRSEVPFVLDEQGNRLYDPANGYRFEPGKDEVIREGRAGWVVSFGEMLYRSLDAVEQLRARGVDVGLINKPTLNVVDEEVMARLGSSPFVLVAEGLNSRTGLGSRFGSWLLERGYAPSYASLGVSKVGEGGTWAQLGHQGLGTDDIVKRIEALRQQ